MPQIYCEVKFTCCSLVLLRTRNTWYVLRKIDFNLSMDNYELSAFADMQVDGYAGVGDKAQ